MKSVKRPCCGAAMKRNGKTGAGSQRWRCRDCGASRTVRYDDEAARLREFVGWLLSKESQRDMPGQGRAFRRRTASFWSIWPMPEVVDEAHRVAFVDGIWVARDAVVLIACTESHVLSWHLARAETSAAWRSLLSRVAPPDMAVSDGGGGFAKAVAAEWPRTRVQRCLFHVFCQVKRQTTTRPQAPGGRRALRAGEGAPAYRDPAPGRMVGRAPPAVVRLPVGLPGAEEPRRRPARLHARAPAQSASGDRLPGQRGHAVHVPRPRAVGGGAAPGDEQRHRRRGERAAAVRPEEPPRPVHAQARQGRLDVADVAILFWTVS